MSSYSLFNCDSPLLLLASNGKIDAIKVSQFFSDDVFFCHYDDIIYNEDNNEMTSVGFNGMIGGDEYTEQFGPVGIVESAILEVVKYVEQNKKLIINRDENEDFYDIFMSDDEIVSGSTYFYQFCSNHWIKIFNESDDYYKVHVNEDCLDKIENCAKYILEFVKTLRFYNEIYDSFSISIIPISLTHKSVISNSIGNVTLPFSVNRFVPREDYGKQVGDEIYLEYKGTQTDRRQTSENHRNKELDDDTIDKLVKLGEISLALEKYEQAEDCYRQLIDVDDENNTLWILLGKSILWQSTLDDLRINEAVECFGKSYKYS
jgi:tetratricopeptide (TPR) repeat protein